MELWVGNFPDLWEVAVETLNFQIFEVWGLVFNHLNLNQIIKIIIQLIFGIAFSHKNAGIKYPSIATAAII